MLYDGPTRAVGSQKHIIALECLDYILQNTNSLLSLCIWDAEGTAFTDIIISHLRQIRVLHWDTTLEAFSSLLNLPPHSFEYLEELDVSWPVDLSPKFPRSVISSLHTAPNFHSIKLGSFVTPYYIPQLLCLPWAQMTNVVVHSLRLSPAVIYATLQQCSTLVSCHLSVNLDTIVPLKSALTLLYLKSLHSRVFWVGFNWAAFLEPFITPLLSEFDVLSMDGCFQALLSLVARSKCTLKKLSINTPHTPSDDSSLELFLRHVPDLADLTLSFTLSAPIIRAIGMLPLFSRGTWNIEPNGLIASLDMVDSLIPYIIFNKRPLFLNIARAGTLDFTKGIERYLASYRMYQKIVGLSIFFSGVGPTFSISRDSLDPESDDGWGFGGGEENGTNTDSGNDSGYVNSYSASP